ncbi:MAG TPA: choice-of-anchor tandem repeat GloVer-containing protein, partial [Candidatus Limnocylindrales bacterium]|nr:choice-of-anchor tandem repeat GloVer-containing protein [Candidatus Limnocylindrales bacterium]
AVNGGGGAGGTVFAVNINGSGFTNLHNFNVSEGYEPLGGLILSGTTLYGTTDLGGSPLYPGDGSVFAVNTDGTGFTNLYTFSALNQSEYTNSDGANSWAGLVLSDNTLYGTTREGGSFGPGTVFAVNTDGTGFLNLHSFTRGSASYPSTNSDGAGPFAGLILSGNTLYGTASALGSSSYGTVFALNPPVLTHVGPLGYSTGGTPARSSNPWQFTVAYSNPVSGLSLEVQSTLTTNRPGSWATLASMTNSNGNWSANPAFVPTGDRYFRVVASALGWVDSVSDLVGPITVLEDLAPFGFFSWQTTGPERNGALWTFTITEPSLISDLRLVVQSSGNLTNWSDLPGGSQMTNSSGNWTLNTTNLPLGQQFFRVVASAPTYVDRISKSLGPFNIEAALTTVTKTNSVAGFHTLSLDDVPEMQDPDIVYEEAVIKAVVQLAFTLNFKQYNAALALAAEQYASVKLLVGKNQTLKIPAVNAGPNASVELQGTINGDVALIGNAGGALIGNAGGALTGNAGTQAAVVSNDGGSLITQDGGGLISQDGGGLISQDGGGLTGKAGAAVSVESKTPLTPRPNIPAFTQPTFTGIMTVNGNYSQFPGTALIIGIAGTNTLAQGAQQFDQLVVSGQANLLGGTIAFGLFNPDDQTNLANVFQPSDGATFDVVVASNIVVNALHLLGPVWGDGLFFKGGVVTLTNGLQAVRLMATHIPPRIFLQNAGPELHLFYGTNYTGYTVESSTNLSDWSAFSTGTNVVPLSLTNSSRFFRLSKP